MKRSLVLLGLSVMTMTAGCGSPTTKSPSRFIDAFSAEDAIKRSYNKADAVKPRLSGGGAGSGGLGITHRSADADLILSAEEAPQFLSRVKAEIEDQISRFGAKKTGEGKGNDSYSVEYSEGALAGLVQVWGMRGEGDHYRLLVLVAER